MPKRIQMTRQRPWRPEHPDAVIVARPTKWGNPYKVVRIGNAAGPGETWATVWMSGEHGDIYVGEHEDRAEAFATILNAYRELVEDDRGLDVDELRGRDLACWCGLDQPCHADVLLGLANGGA